ncbi:MAG TPA: glycosyltransferase family 4 protein [Sphingomicrobium sp.]|nr:glycosyltransferase family 4 protein [Sphingomicrobium sp.]
MRIFVVTRSYPAPGDLYKYPFVHRRVVAYRAAGHEVRVFRPDAAQPLSSHDFDGISCWTGGAEALASFAAEWKPDVVAVHGLSEAMWDALAPIASRFPVRAWLHGSEIPAFMRHKSVVLPEPDRTAALRQVEGRCRFWRRLLGDLPARLKLVFVSKASVDLAREDLASVLDEDQYEVVPNPVDTDLFAYREKAADDRYSVLLIRPFDSRTYANDLAVEAIGKLVSRGPSGRLRFTIIGDGPLFDQTLAPLANVPNVSISRRFLRQEEIAREHARHGIFLVPTRLDTQGLSRDEAMASGLVPVTNAIPAVREFVDDRCAALAPPDDSDSLADRIAEMIDRPPLFLDRSRAAAQRIRRERSNAQIIPRELRLLAEAADA